MQCDNCGKDTEEVEFRTGYNLQFCDSANIPIAQESCMEQFERKLWEAAKSRKQAERKAESKATDFSDYKGAMVGGIKGDE